MIRCLLILLCLPIFVSAAFAQEKPRQEEWQVMLLEGKRIGWVKTTTQSLQNGNLRIRQESQMKLKRFGQSIDLQTVMETVEKEDGELLSFEFVIRNPPNRPTSQKGSIDGNELNLELTVNGRTTNRRVVLPPHTKSPLLQERIFRQQKPRVGNVTSIATWQPELSKPATLKFRVDQPRETKLFDGSKERLFKVFVENSAVPTLKLRGYVDEKGIWRKSETDFLGKTLETYAVSGKEAMKELAGGELDLALNSVIRVERLRDPHRSAEVVYQLSLEDDDPSRYFHTSAGQTVKKLDDRTLQLTVKAVEPPPRSALAKKVDREYLAKTDFLQTDDRRVKELASRSSAGTADSYRVAQNMEQTVFRKVRDKNFSTALASAAETAESLEGDCTEHAMLLAAMLRAERIPSRVAIGFVYARSVGGFAGHMWTEAWIRDRWVPLDATLGKGAIAAGHLKLSDSSLGENAPAPISEFLPMLNLLGKLKVEVVSQR